ncbi:hypothetical protein F5878DRAFT_662195 [Lentinula raphanica]|uniref:Uncharacterized protein n=1 Tax=Lentinula raphanica TaxID=153919 RepID=A0AA38UDK1_9AGAR|nr:hypothetical protein F5878DRAFT_662195 [Lentinula raphanica]
MSTPSGFCFKQSWQRHGGSSESFEVALWRRLISGGSFGRQEEEENVELAPVSLTDRLYQTSYRGHHDQDSRALKPLDESTDEETSSKSPSVWWRRRTYDYATYRLDSDGVIQKIHHDPDGEELSAKTRGRTKTPPPKGGLKKTENFHGDRGGTPVSFKPLARPVKYFVQGGVRTSNLTNETFGPTKLEMSSFKSSDSEGHNAWHSSQSPHDLDVPLPETPTPRLVGTTYVHRNTTDGGYQVWVWCSREGGEFAWYPVDLNNEQETQLGFEQHLDNLS